MGVKTLTAEELDQIVDSLPISTELSSSGLDSPFLRQLATAGREILDELMTEQILHQGQMVFVEGEMGEAMYIIWSGRAAVIKGDLQAPIVLGYRGPGEIIGEMALLENRPRSASVVALENMRLLSISRTDFEKLLQNNPSVGMGILGTLSARLRAADDARNAGWQAEDRLSRQISELQTEKQQLLELQQLRQETTDLIVHDLRHPISSLFGIIKLLEMVLPPDVLEANRSLLNLGNSTCENMQLLVDSLLDIARMESGDMQLQLEELNLKQLVTDAANRPVLPVRDNVSLRLDLPAELPPVLGDREKLERVMGNLVGNAIKYTSGGGTITVAVVPNQDHVKVIVADTGPGIPPEDRQRIFERFTRIKENSATRKGFGLGLAFCKLAVEAHQGTIWVEGGENGIGSRFIFTLPFQPAGD